LADPDRQVRFGGQYRAVAAFGLLVFNGCVDKRTHAILACDLVPDAVPAAWACEAASGDHRLRNRLTRLRRVNHFAVQAHQRIERRQTPVPTVMCLDVAASRLSELLAQGATVQPAD